MADFSQKFTQQPQNFLTQFTHQPNAYYRLNNSDSDQESIETNDSNNEQKNSQILKQIIFEKQPEIDVKPKQRIFFSLEEKQKYIENYQKKIKTEICKNWAIKGICPYGNKCSFAHGQHELQNKYYLKSTYKTKPCQKYFIHGFCPYGYRCQYLHSEIINYPQFKQYLKNLFQFKSLPLEFLDKQKQSYQQLLTQIETEETIPKNFNRLNIFNELEENKKKFRNSMMNQEFHQIN